MIHFSPFPCILVKGAGAYLSDLDGHEYLDMCGEYSAGLFGHSHPVIQKAMVTAIQDGVALGGVNKYEGRVAQLLCARFPSIERIRFSNSGTEAVQTALSLVRAYTGKDTFIVCSNGYHGGLAIFNRSSGRSMNVPHKWVQCAFNDSASLVAAVKANEGDVAAIVFELMQGGSGCVPARPEFVQLSRDLATKENAVLLFDEVMTSRMAVGGLQSTYGVKPDMTTLGKYLAGGGQNFGAFGGRAAIMDLLQPGNPQGAYHSGTYNNNVTTMAAAQAVLEHVWTPEAIQDLYDLGEWLRGEIRALATETNTTLRVTGLGSMMTLNFSTQIQTSEYDVVRGDNDVKQLFFLDMLRKGYFMAPRCMVSLMTVHTKEQLQGFLAAVREFLEERKAFVADVHS